MTEEQRDPELESVQAAWSAPPPSAIFHARVLSAYESEFGRSRWRRFWPVVAVAFAAGILVAFAIAPRLTRTGTVRYIPVQQPRFVIISQGERP